MELKQNPFSFYDFLGYFTPGAMLLYGAMYAGGHMGFDGLSVKSVATTSGLDKADLYVPFVLFAYAIGHLLSFVSSITIERYSLWAMGYPSKYLLGVKSGGYFQAEKNRKLRAFMRCLVFLLILPVSLFDLLLGRGLGLRDLYAKRLDPLLVGLIRGKVYALMKAEGGVNKPGEYGNANETDFFHFAYHYAVEKAPNHLPKMQNYVAIYGFLRTLCLLSVIMFWVLAAHMLRGEWHDHALHFLLIGSVIVCYLFFMAFVKFYRRFSLEALMAISVSYK